MAMREVAALTGTIISIASTIQDLGNSWYRASKEWNDFPQKVDLLKIKHKFWLAEFAKFGMLSDPEAEPLIHTLEIAKLLLKPEEDKLLKRQDKGKRSCGTGCWAKSSMTIFPAQLGLRIDSVISAFDNIQVLLKMKEEAEAALENWEQSTAFSLPFQKDPRYVPLEETERAVRSALASPDRVVVLLHGAPGKGKSTLARAIAREYKEAADGAALFEDVFYLECGPRAKPAAVQFTLLQYLGVAVDPQEEAGPGSKFPKRLQRRLQNRKLLIIFDDVWEAEFLQEMVNLCGSGIKCLVTSQRGDMWRDLHCSKIMRIAIENVHLEDARKILASYVGFSDHVIPQHLEGIVDEVIQEIERNPLALAIIGGSIDTSRSDELDIWEATANDLVVKLNHCSPHIINLKYPRSLWATMKRSFESLEKGAQSLLILVDMCDGLSVPEEVLELLHQSTRVPGVSSTNLDFAKLRQELESREMVKIASVSEGPRKQRAWSLHSLQKKFIEGVAENARESVLASLKGLSSSETGSQVEPEVVREFSLSEEDILISLAALYFDQQFKEPALTAALKMGIPSHKFNNLRRRAIEPVIRLLGQPISKRWTKSLHTSAKRVFMGYISSDTLNDNDISDLLVSPISTRAMMNVLGGIAALGETTLLDERLHNYVNVLIDLLENGNDGEGNTNTVQEAAHKALRYLCQNEACRTFIATKLPRVSDTLIRQLLTNSYPESIRRWSAGTLGQLCRFGKGNVRETIIQYPGFLVYLMELLSLENYLYLRHNATFLVGHLANGRNDIKLKLVNTGVLLEQLVKLLLKDDQPYTQRLATFALAALAEGVGEVKVKMLEKLREIPSTMDGLSRLLAEHVHPVTQYFAAKALTLIYPKEGNAVHLYSGPAYGGRGYANTISGNYKAALADLDKALEMEPKNIYALRGRSCVLGKQGNYEGALADANKVIEMERTPYSLLQRGVLKHMMGDLSGAMVDFNEVVLIEMEFIYEALKCRGYIKFLMNDEVGAIADAQWALQIKPPRVDDLGYGRDHLEGPIQYLGYTLR